jgi:cytochrome b subunit of formate dehydrogenase
MASKEATSKSQEAIKRFSLPQRLEHIVLLISFGGLALTGLPQKFIPQQWAMTMIAAMGGIVTVRIIHRILATILALETFYHLLTLAYQFFVLHSPPHIMLGFQDFRDMFQHLGYNLGIAKSRPRMSRFNFEEKIEYWAGAWGVIIMGITGFMLWNPIAITSVLPGELIPAAKAAHGAEAILAVAAILTWHMYAVHIRHFNPSIFTGKISRKMMEEEHALELEATEAGRAPRRPDPETYRKRMRIFLPIAIIVGIVLVVGLAWFLTFEQTAVTTIPPYEIEVVPSDLMP